MNACQSDLKTYQMALSGDNLKSFPWERVARLSQDLAPSALTFSENGDFFPGSTPEAVVVNEMIMASQVISFFLLDSVQATEPDTRRVQEALSDTHKVISAAIDNLASPNYLQIFIACAMLLFVISPILFPVSQDSLLSLHQIAGKVLCLVRIAITVVLTGFLFYLIFNAREEYSAYKSVLQMIDIQLKQISPRNRMSRAHLKQL